MNDGLIRCIDSKGSVKFLPAHITKKASFMRKYGYKVEHLPKKQVEPAEPTDPVTPPAPETETPPKTTRPGRKSKKSS